VEVEGDKADGRAAPPHDYVLLIEDDEEGATPLANCCSALATTSSARRTARKPSSTCGVGRACVILLDLLMPVMDGWEFRKQQQATPRWAPSP